MSRINARLPTGLRWRLTAWVAGVLLLAAGAIFVVVYTDTGTQLRSQIDRDLASDTSQFAQALRPYAGRSRAEIVSVARRYVRAQPYRATSTLLFALVPGYGTVSNHLELFGGSAHDDGESGPQQAAENIAGHGLRAPLPGYSAARIPDVGAMRLHERAVQLAGLRVVVGAGEPLYTAERAQHSLARAFLLAGAVILVLALIASYLAGARVSAPLRRMAALAARVDAGDLAPRMDVAPRGRDELRVLGESFNHMLDRLEEAFRGQRDFVADASHELRTPLTVMRGQLEVLAAQGDPPADELRRVEHLLLAEVARMTRLVEDLLLLAKSEQVDFLREQPIELASFVAQLWDGIVTTASRRFELGPVPRGTLVADPDRLAQALRNLLDNAIAHTEAETGLVRLDVERIGSGTVRFIVTDDGPGIPAAERERVFRRFHRTDAARTRAAGGTGLGLAIVRAVVDAHGGDVRVADPPPPAHGARIELTLRGFVAATDHPAAPVAAHRA